MRIDVELKRGNWHSGNWQWNVLERRDLCRDRTLNLCEKPLESFVLVVICVCVTENYQEKKHCKAVDYTVSGARKGLGVAHVATSQSGDSL